MTTPVEPATGTPGAPATGSTSEPPATTGQQPATGGQNATDWASLFEGMTPEQVQEQLGHARTWEKRAKDNKAQVEKLTKAQQPKAGEPTPDDLQAQLTEAQQAREAAEERAAELAYEGAVTRIAATVNADPDALLDSDSFRNAVTAELEKQGDDWDDDDLKKAVKKVAADFAKKPRFAANTPTASPRGGTDMAGGNPPPVRDRLQGLGAAVGAALKK